MKYGDKNVFDKMSKGPLSFTESYWMARNLESIEQSRENMYEGPKTLFGKIVFAVIYMAGLVCIGAAVLAFIITVFS